MSLLSLYIVRQPREGKKFRNMIGVEKGRGHLFPDSLSKKLIGRWLEAVAHGDSRVDVEVVIADAPHKIASRT